MITIQDGLVLQGPELEPKKANLIIEDKKIVEIGPNTREGIIINAEGCIVAPSFINSHIHLGDSVVKDLGDGEPLEKIVKPPHGLKHQLLRETPTSQIISAMQGAMKEAMCTGTSTLVDFREGGISGINMAFKASGNFPTKNIVLGRHESFFDPHLELSQVVKNCQEILKFADGIGLSGFGEITDEIAFIITKTCRDEGKLSAIHVAEYEEVQRKSLLETGKTEVERAVEAGFDLLIHFTSPLASDLELVAERGISVVVCPRSNGALGVGIPPIKEMWKSGINLLLGTDNVMFNSPNMFREMEYALKATRGRYKEHFPPVEVLKMATVNAEKTFNLHRGYLKEGMIADIMVVEQQSPDPILSLINRTETKNIISLLTDGNLVYQR